MDTNDECRHPRSWIKSAAYVEPQNPENEDDIAIMYKCRGCGLCWRSDGEWPSILDDEEKEVSN